MICNNLVSCSQKIVNTSPGLISTMMQNLNSSSNSRLPNTYKLNTGSSNTDCNDVLQNFAPLGKRLHAAFHLGTVQLFLLE